MILPKQRIPFHKKNEEWKKQTIDYFERLSYSTATGIRTTNFNKIVNYDLYNGRFNKADLEYVCNPLGLKDNEFPATLQHYDVVTPAFNLLIGEETQRPDNTIVISESPEDINRKEQSFKDKIMSLLQQEIEASLNGDEKNKPDDKAYEQLLKYDNYNISDIVESQANKILKNLKKKLNVKEVFKKGFKDALLSGEEIYWTGVSNKEPMLRRCNPVNITIVLDGDSDFIDDAQAVIEVRMISPNTILDEFGDKLTPKQVAELEDLTRSTNNAYASSGYDNPTFRLSNHGGVEDIGGTYASTSGSSNQNLIRVVRIEWLSMKKLYELTYTDIETGMSLSTIVDEIFQLKSFKEVYPDAKLEEFWVSEAWEGIKIGTDMYIDVKPKLNQRRRMDNPYVAKLGYVGLIYNATNSISVSLMDRLKPYQYLYNIISYRLELAFASDMGKIFLMDLAQIPRSEGLDIEKWMYYLRAMKIAFVNSFEEGRKGVATGKLSTFNQFQSVDMSLANVIQQYIQTLEYIKNQIAFISGVSPQRLGAINSNELVGNVQRSVQQSSLITEFMFDSHQEVKRRVYTSLIEAAKIAYKDGLVTQYVLDDMSVEMLKLDEFELENSEFNVYVSNSVKDNQVIQDLKELSRLAIQSDKADLSTIIDTIINDNPRDIVRTLQASEKAKYERDAKAQEAAMQQEKAIQDKKDQLEERRLELEQYIADSNNQTKIQIAEIDVYKFQQNLDQNNNGVPDPVELANQSLKEREANSKAFRENMKLQMDKDKHDKEVSLKEKELSSRENIEKLKIQQTKIQNDNQIELANKKAKLDKEMMDKKLQLERIKLRSKNNKTKK